MVRILLEDRFGLDPGSALLRAEESMTAEETKDWDDCTARLMKAEPVQYVCGSAHFAGMMLRVSPAVLIPRPETEELFLLAKQGLLHSREPVILDLCTGSGCLAIGIKKNFPGARVLGLDVSEAALHLARTNGMEQKTAVEWLLADITLPEAGRGLPWLDMMVSNPPYVLPNEAAAMQRHVLDYEPPLALFTPPGDALYFYRFVVAIAQEKLRPGGILLLEINPTQASALEELLTDQGFIHTQAIPDLQGRLRMIRSEKPPDR